MATLKPITCESPPWLQHLDAHGYAVVPSVVDIATCEEWKRSLRDDLFAFTKGVVDLDVPDTHKHWPADFALSHSMLIQHGGIGQAQTLWKVRQHPNIFHVFATAWGDEELLVSMDALSVHLAPEVTGRGFFKGREWLHTDQGPATPGDCIQGLVTLNDVAEYDATLYVLDGSHKHWAAYFAAFPPKKPKENWHKLETPEQLQFFLDRGCAKVAVPMRAGSVALWNSKTFHCGREALKERPRPMNRLVVYVCMMPAPADAHSPAAVKLACRRLKALAAGRTTAHWIVPKLFPLKPHTYGAPAPDVAYPAPQSLWNLTPLGRRLVGYRPDVPAIVACAIDLFGVEDGDGRYLETETVAAKVARTKE